MKPNAVLQQDVMEALRWEPGLNAAQIGVLAQNGIVTLTGRADSIAQKFKAERVAKRVAGVKAIVQELEVELSGHHVRTAQFDANGIEVESTGRRVVLTGESPFLARAPGCRKGGLVSTWGNQCGGLADD